MEKRTIIVDIDGTIADNSHRFDAWDTTRTDLVEYYKRCIDDTPIQWVIDWVNALKYAGYYIVVLTARDEIARKPTEEWLKLQNLQYDELHFGNRADKRRGYIIKREFLETRGLSEICFCIEDNPPVIEMMDELGLIVFDVKNEEWLHGKPWKI